MTSNKENANGVNGTARATGAGGDAPSRRPVMIKGQQEAGRDQIIYSEVDGLYHAPPAADSRGDRLDLATGNDKCSIP